MVMSVLPPSVVGIIDEFFFLSFLTFSLSFIIVAEPIDSLTFMNLDTVVYIQ
jgi:hypothetical protein